MGSSCLSYIPSQKDGYRTQPAGAVPGWQLGKVLPAINTNQRNRLNGDDRALTANNRFPSLWDSRLSQHRNPRAGNLTLPPRCGRGDQKRPLCIPHPFSQAIPP